MKERLFFGVDSKVPANRVLQNNLTLFEWARRNKTYPAFWARNISGKDCLTKDEIDFLYDKACKVAAVYCNDDRDSKDTEERGRLAAEKAAKCASDLGENFDALNEYPVEEWHGGKVHQIRPHVLHLMRGQAFELQGRTFFTMGGGVVFYLREDAVQPSLHMSISEYHINRITSQNCREPRKLQCLMMRTHKSSNHL